MAGFNWDGHKMLDFIWKENWRQCTMMQNVGTAFIFSTKLFKSCWGFLWLANTKQFNENNSWGIKITCVTIIG